MSVAAAAQPTQSGHPEYRRNTIGSIIGTFEDGNRGSIAGVYRTKIDDSAIVMEEPIGGGGGNENTVLGENHKDDFTFKMTKKEYLQSIFGPSINLKTLKEHETLRQKVRHVLLSNYFNVAVMVLVLLDSIFVTIELIIDMESLSKKKESSHHADESLHHAAEFFRYLSFAIICFFVIEICVKIIVMRKEFFHSKMEVIDGIIVYVSFALDVAFMNNHALSAIVGILALFRYDLK